MSLQVEVVYIDDQQQLFYRQLDVDMGTTVEGVLIQSGIYEQFPESKALKTGIFSRPVDRELEVQAGDRVEVYRPLVINPMEKRRLRSIKGGAQSAKRGRR